MNTSRRRVQTVHGPIDASKLGFTLSHEHICNCTPEFREKWPKSFGGREGLVARAVEQLKSLRASGVDTLIDLTPFDVGRDIRLIEEVSRKSGIQIVACDQSGRVVLQHAHTDSAPEADRRVVRTRSGS
jgi:phosphotriesterase-related protein